MALLILFLTYYRWGNTPLDEARTCGNKNLIKLLEDARSVQLAQSPDRVEEMIGKQMSIVPKVFVLTLIAAFFSFLSRFFSPSHFLNCCTVD